MQEDLLPDRGESSQTTEESLITADEVLGFLGGRNFAEELSKAVKGSGIYERALYICWSPTEKGFCIKHPHSTSPDAVERLSLEWAENEGVVEVLAIHVHPVDFRSSGAYIPSPFDLIGPFGLEWKVGENFVVTVESVDSVVIPGGKPEAWIWQVPEESLDKPEESLSRKVQRTFDEWEKGLFGERLTYRDIDELEGQLKEAGLKLVRGRLQKDNLVESFVDLVRRGGFKFGIFKV